MELKAEFRVTNLTLPAEFDKVQNVSDGGYERGYAAGLQVGAEAAQAELSKAQAEIIGLIAHQLGDAFGSEKVVTVGGYAFADIASLLRVDLPNATTFGNYAFQSCTNLAELNIPKAKTIGTRTFVNTTRLLRLDLPVCESIGGYCFHGSAKISTLILRSEKVCTLGADAFGTGPIKAGTGFVYVPAALLGQYKTAANWSTYAAQIRAIEDYPEICG